MPVGATPVLVAKYERGHSRVSLAWCREGRVLHAVWCWWMFMRACCSLLLLSALYF